MTDTLQIGLTWLAARLKAGVSQSVVYRRGTLSVTIAATLGAKVLRVTDSAGRSKIERADMDFIFTSADLDFGSGPVTPEVNDKVDLTLDGTTYRYDVLPIGSEPHYRRVAHGTITRVHGKLRGEV